MVTIVNGKSIAESIKENLCVYTSSLSDTISFHIIYVGSDPVIDNFIKYKRIFGEALGVHVVIHYFKKNITQEELKKNIQHIDHIADAVIVQLPLPEHISSEDILNTISPDKDVDVLGSVSQEHFKNNTSLFFPPVAGSIVYILRHHGIHLDNKKIVVIGNGSLVGYPMSLWLDKNNHKYTIITKETNEHTKKQYIKEADIIISGAGVPHMITKEMIKEGVVLIDAGTSESGKKVVGDIHPECYQKASLVTPVPGGIGPMTIAILYQNIISTYQNKHDK